MENFERIDIVVEGSAATADVSVVDGTEEITEEEVKANALEVGGRGADNVGVGKKSITILSVLWPNGTGGGGRETGCDFCGGGVGVWRCNMSIVLAKAVLGVNSAVDDSEGQLLFWRSPLLLRTGVDKVLL
jgi:hypothetical protein